MEEIVKLLKENNRLIKDNNRMLNEIIEVINIFLSRYANENREDLERNIIANLISTHMTRI